MSAKLCIYFHPLSRWPGRLLHPGHILIFSHSLTSFLYFSYGGPRRCSAWGFLFCRITRAEIAVNGAYKAAILTKLNKNETKTLCIKSKITLS
nr:MAG TPA: membrane-associated protein [Caudoviricetes sp.]